MNRGPGSGKVLNGSEGVKGGRVLNVTVSSTTLLTDIRPGGHGGPEWVRGVGESNDYRFRIWKSKSMVRVKLSLIRQQGAIGGHMGPQGVVGI